MIFCAFGSECFLKSDQFKEILLGFELTRIPFLAALKPPIEAEAIESALPEGFNERIKGRRVVHGDWVQQLLILSHPSVGFFVIHCGSGSLTEAKVNECQLIKVQKTVFLSFCAPPKCFAASCRGLEIAG